MKPTEAELTEDWQLDLDSGVSLLWVRCCKPKHYGKQGPLSDRPSPPCSPHSGAQGLPSHPSLGEKTSLPVWRRKAMGAKHSEWDRGGRGLQRWEHFKLVHWCLHAVCSSLSHSEHGVSHTLNSHLLLVHTQACGATQWHCEPAVFYSSPAALSLSPRGCLLMRDTVKCTVTFSYWLKWPSRAS